MIKDQIQFFRRESKSLLSSFKKNNSFARNFSYLFSAKSFGLLLGICLTPVLTRIYSPDAYGTFSIINAIAINFAAISMLSYENALVIVNSEKKFYNLFALCLVLIGFTFILSLIVEFFFSQEILEYIGLKNESPYFLLLLSLTIVIYALKDLQPHWNIRRSQFKYAAKVGVTNHIMTKSTSLAIGFLSGGWQFGIIIGELVGKLLAISLNTWKNLVKEWVEFRNAISFMAILDFSKEEVSYPKYMFPGRYLTLLIGQLPIFVISLFFNKEILGNYSLAASIIYLPITFLSNTMSPLVLKKIKDKQHQKLEISGFIKKASVLITIISVPFTIIFIFFSRPIFEFIFGSEWKIAGEMGELLSLIVVIFILNVFSRPLYQVYKKEKNLFNLILFELLICALLVLPGILLNDYYFVILGYVVSLFAFNWIRLRVALKIVNASLDKLLISILVMYLVFFLVKY